MKTVVRVAGLIGLIGVAASQPARSANFFDDLAGALFGGQRQAAPIIMNEPLEMTVRSKRRGPPPEFSSKPSPPVVKLDPATEPNWYLRDPTLRHGDIVVTRNGVLVYQGGGRDLHAKADFAALGGAKSKKGGWQQQVHAAAAGGRIFFNEQGPRAATMAQTAEPAR